MLKFNCFHVLKVKPFFFKIKMFISGRVFKWVLYKNKISFFFIHANKKLLFFNKNFKMSILKPSKGFFIFKFFQQLNTFSFFLKIKKIKTCNIFTKRGILFKNSIFLKKKGKISTYITNV